MKPTAVTPKPLGDLQSAVALNRAFVTGEASAEQITQAALRAATAVQPALNCFAHLGADVALAQARLLDTQRASGATPGILAGVPLSVKDIINTRDMPTQWGSLLMKGQVPPADAVSVARLRAAGGVSIGKSTTSEFAYKLLTDSRLHGVTRNPWNLAHTPGGSSGGAAASVAAGVTPIALATDAGASTRLPAGCCGVLGLKPTLGMVPHNQVPDGFGNFIHLGLIAREAADLALMLDVLQGPHSSDPHSLGRSAIDHRRELLLPLEPSKLRIRWLRLAGNQALDPEIDERCQQVLRALERDGAVIEAISEPIDNPGPTWKVLQQANWAGRWGARLEEIRALIESGYARGIADGLALSGPQLMQAISRRTEIFRKVQGWFDHAELIATPVMSALPLPLDHTSDQPLVIGGKPVGDLREEWIPYLNLFNLSSHPAISIPCGLSRGGLPIAIQFVARWQCDAVLIRLAAWMQGRSEFCSGRPTAISTGAS